MTNLIQKISPDMPDLSFYYKCTNSEKKTTHRTWSFCECTIIKTKAFRLLFALSSFVAYNYL